ncbi:hypothetical protein F5X96DRAFT_152413 [Biscogniauxia mediterranea]|nr:hypothetical protein F5X96DRAFT_152413 [Biscogniauxia mediterranea]
MELDPPAEDSTAAHTDTPIQPQQHVHDLHQQVLFPPAPGRTLLPGPIASAVSLATRSTSFALRVGTFIGGYGLSAAKVTTLSSLELGRGILEGILSRAGKDVAATSRSELGRMDAESILEKSLESLHQTMSQIVFWTSTGFHITDTTVSTASQVSQLFLSVLDQFFGSTDSSRAIASIITLIRREFQNPATGIQGEKVGVVDLLVGLCGLAYLQNWCRRMIQEETRRLGQEEIVWDVVVLNDGARVDVHDDQLYDAHNPHPLNAQPPSPTSTSELIGAIEEHGARHAGHDDDDLPEIQLKHQILKSLPKDAKVSISTATTISKTITVDIKGATSMSIPSLPGLDLVESEVSNPEDHLSKSRGSPPNYRVVYKVSRKKVKNTPEDSENDDDTRSHVQEMDDDNDDDEPSSPVTSIRSHNSEHPPPVPPKVTRPTIASAAKSCGTVACEYPVRSASNSSNGSTAGSPRYRTFAQSMSKPAPEHAANQKRTRKPLDESSRNPKGLTIVPPPVDYKPSNKKSDSLASKSSEKKGGLRGALKKGSVPAFANLLNRESNSDHVPVTNTKSKSNIKPPWGSNKPSHGKSSGTHSRGPIPDRTSSLAPSHDVARTTHRGNRKYLSSRDAADARENAGGYRAPSRSSYLPLQDNRRSSLVSLTDTFSIHSYESRSSSPVLQKTEAKSHGGASRSKSAHDGVANSPPSPNRPPPRPKSQNQSLYTPSIYTLGTKHSQASLILSSYLQKSAYSDSEAVDTLRRTGTADGMFPNFHILRNITRYCRFASAAYGSNFLRFMGINKEITALKIMDEVHQDVRSFAHHTDLPPDSILLSSFVDPQGGSDSTGSTDTGVPLVHTIALDEESKAVVLSCRGTLGFEDVLADMMCEYDDLVWRGKAYKVHKGIHASARRLLYGGDGRVLVTLKEALEEFPDYGLVLCGHSLGGAVTALLGAMLAEPAMTGTAFVTSAEQHKRLLADGRSSNASTHICLPSGRPIHVYAYGPPSTMSPSLQKATRGLITSTVHGNDLVPYLSLGVLHDLQALALAFKSDNNEAKAEVRRRIWEGLQSGLASKWYNNGPKHSTDEEDKWAYAALKTLRASMMSSKLLPPGEVFSIETTPAFRRDAFVTAETENIGKPATRIVLKYVRDVEARFREVRFGSSMLLDHSPGRYEDALRRLMLGVVES